jgi:hypothetical protein
MPDVPAGNWTLRTSVPEGIFTLAIEADDAAAAAEHAAFADRCQPLLLRAVGGDAEEAAWLRTELIDQLAALRETVAADGLGYLGALAGDQGGRPVLILLGIAVAPVALPNGIDPASLLAAMLHRQYPGAAVEEFPTAHGVGVGLRRCTAGAVRPAVRNRGGHLSSVRAVSGSPIARHGHGVLLHARRHRCRHRLHRDDRLSPDRGHARRGGGLTYILIKIK